MVFVWLLTWAIVAKSAFRSFLSDRRNERSQRNHKAVSIAITIHPKEISHRCPSYRLTRFSSSSENDIKCFSWNSDSLSWDLFIDFSSLSLFLDGTRKHFRKYMKSLWLSRSSSPRLLILSCLFSNLFAVAEEQYPLTRRRLWEVEIFYHLINYDSFKQTRGGGEIEVQFEMTNN